MNNKVNSVLNSIEKIDHLVMEADVSVSDAMNDVYNKQFKMEGNVTEDYINHEYYQESVIAGILIGGGIIAVLATAIVLITKHVKKSASGDPEKKDDKSTAAGIALDKPEDVKKRLDEVAKDLEKLGGKVTIPSGGINIEEIKNLFKQYTTFFETAENVNDEANEEAIDTIATQLDGILDKITGSNYKQNGNVEVDANTINELAELSTVVADMTKKSTETATKLHKRAEEAKKKADSETDDTKKQKSEALNKKLSEISKKATNAGKVSSDALSGYRGMIDQIIKSIKETTEKNKSSEAEKSKTDDNEGKTDNSETNNISTEDTKSIAGFTHDFMMKGLNKSGPGIMPEEDIKKILNELVSASKTKTGDDFDDEIRRLFTAQENDEFKYIYLDLVVHASNDLLNGKVNLKFVNELKDSIGTGKDIKLSNLGDMDSVDGSGKGSPLPVIDNNGKKDTSDMDSILPPITKTPAEILNKVIRNNPNYKQFENESNLINKVIPRLSAENYNTLINDVNATMSNVKYHILAKALFCDIAKEIATEHGWTDKLDNFKLSEDAQKELDQYLKTVNPSKSEDTTKKDTEQQPQPEKQSPQTKTLRWLLEDPEAAINYANNTLRPNNEEEIDEMSKEALIKVVNNKISDALVKFCDNYNDEEDINFDDEMNWADSYSICYYAEMLNDIHDNRNDINKFLKQQYSLFSGVESSQNSRFQLAKAYVELHSGPNKLLSPDGTMVSVNPSKSEDTTKKDTEHTDVDQQTDETKPTKSNENNGNPSNITSEQDEKFEELRQKITANLKNKYPSGCNVISLYGSDIEDVVTVILGMCMSNKSEQEIQNTADDIIFGFIKSTTTPDSNNVRYAIPNKKFKDQPAEYQNALNALINAVNISIDEANKITGNSYTIDTRKYSYGLTGKFYNKTISPHADLKEVMTNIENKFGETQQQSQTSNDTQPENTNQNTDSDTSNLSGLARLKDHIQVPDIVKEVNQLDEPGVKEISKSDMQELQKASEEKLMPFIEKGMEIYYNNGNSYKLDSMPLSRKNVRMILSFAKIINQIYDANTDLDDLLTQKYSKDINPKLKDFYYQMAKLYAQEMNIHVTLTDPNGKKEEINANPVFN